jgi:hypothetical protein
MGRNHLCYSNSRSLYSCIPNSYFNYFPYFLFLCFTISLLPLFYTFFLSSVFRSFVPNKPQETAQAANVARGSACFTDDDFTSRLLCPVASPQRQRISASESCCAAMASTRSAWLGRRRLTRDPFPGFQDFISHHHRTRFDSIFCSNLERFTILINKFLERNAMCLIKYSWQLLYKDDNSKSSSC